MKKYFILLVFLAISYQSALADGIWGCGLNSSGQLGDNSTSDKNVPTYNYSGTEWIMLSCGDSHVIAIKQDRTIWAWGANSSGQLGIGITENSAVPQQIASNDKWLAVSAGQNFSMAIRSDGTLWGWGENTNGQLGDGSQTNRYAPVQIGDGNDWDIISCGHWHSLAIKKDGSLWAWGANSNGQLGDGTTTRRLSPVRIGNSTNWAKVCASEIHSHGIKKNGTLWGWGNNYYGQLGDLYLLTRRSPDQIGNDNDWADISDFYMHSIALKTDGTLWGWGLNLNGQVGDGSRLSKYWPVQIGSANNWTNVSAGSYHSAARNTAGEIWTWGSNINGKLGDGTDATIRTNPVMVVGTGYWSGVKCGSRYTLGIKANPLTINVTDKEICPNGTSPNLGSTTVDALGNTVINTATGGSGQYEFIWYPETGLENPSSSNPTDPTFSSIKSYYLTVNDLLSGETTSKNFIISEKLPISISLPLIVTIPFGSAANLGANLSVSNAANPMTYYWTDKSGWSSTSANPSVMPSQSGISTYYLTVTDATGCVSAEKRIRVFMQRNPKESVWQNEETIAESSDGMQIIAYPNPAVDNLNILADFVDKTDITLKIMDLTGKTLISESKYGVEAIETIINVSDLANGIYILSVETNNGNLIRKFIKQ